MAEPSYIAEAFKLRGNLAFLGIGAITAFVIGNPVLTGGLIFMELGFLFMMSSNPRFRRAIRARKG